MSNNDATSLRVEFFEFFVLSSRKNSVVRVKNSEFIVMFVFNDV